MSVPDFQTIMLPLLKYLNDEKEHSLRESIDDLADIFKLTEEQRRELVPSGRDTTFGNRVAWAKTYMKKAGLIEQVRRGYFKISAQGKEALAQNLAKIDIKYLMRYPDFKAFREVRHEDETVEAAEGISTSTPEESLEAAFSKIKSDLADELLQQLKSSHYSMFEKIVVDLLLKMGYGGSRKDAGQAIGKSGDEGIDGIIKEDRLGLDIIYIQAKRWENQVGRPEIQRFAGALQGKRAKKGIFITTSNFSREAREYASNIDPKIILLGGEELAELMIDHGVGVAPIATYEVKRLDTDYFEEE